MATTKKIGTENNTNKNAENYNNKNEYQMEKIIIQYELLEMEKALMKNKMERTIILRKLRNLRETGKGLKESIKNASGGVKAKGFGFIGRVKQ